ncbi:anti-sigma-D factor RsdA [Nocardia rhizosphaerae]|uniref:Anti-sigma-D factor RsdA n=1 Tax=Nocardia rhizosphaerae TaxID=1691571 RepID=A0ABV8L3I2_9NOCA
MRSDDALIDAIASDGPVRTDSPEEFQLASLLADWRADLLAEPMPAGPDLDTVFAAVNQEIGARQVRVGASSRGRLRLVRPLLGAAAALAVVFGGLTAFSYSAAPGDPLWRVKEVVFSEQAQSTVVARADDDLIAAQNLLDSGDPEQARVRLEKASATASQVDDQGKREDLIARWHLVRDQLAAKAPEIAAKLPTMPPTPGSTKPTSPAPVTPAPGTPAPTAPTGPGSGTTEPTDPSVPPVIMNTPGPETKPVVPTEPVEPTAPTQPPVEPTAPTQPPVEPTVPPTTPPVTVPTAPATTIVEPPPVVPTAVPTSQVPPTLPVPPLTVLPVPPGVPAP